MLRAALLVSAILAAAPAFAQESQSAPACAAVDARLPPEFSAWAQKETLASATKADSLSKAALAVGKAYTADLHPTPEVAYITQPEKPGGSVSKGGIFSLKVDTAGTYRIALGSAAWLDVLKDGAAQKTAGFGHGPDCTSIRKVVDFPLQPGEYVVQVSANADAKLPIMVLRR